MKKAPQEKAKDKLWNTLLSQVNKEDSSSEEEGKV